MDAVGMARTWRGLLGSAALVLAAAGAGSCGTDEPLVTGAADADPATEAPTARNLVLIIIDDLRADPPCGAVSPTPNLDRLAEQGTRFERAFVQQAVCAASRASLLTGMRPRQTGILDLNETMADVCPEYQTLADLFRANGYATRAYGKVYHHGADDDPDGYEELQTLSDGSAFSGVPSTERSTASEDELSDGQIALAGIAALHELADHPFFITLGFKKPHLPFIAPASYWDEFDGQVALPTYRDKPVGTTDGGVQGSGELRNYSDILDGHWGDPLVAGGAAENDAKALELIQGYCAAAAYTDAQLGRVLETVSELGLDDDTAIIVVSDHGFVLGEYGFWTKHTTYEYATRVPLVVSVPGAPSGRQTNAVVELVDLYPTAIDLMRLPAPSQALAGESLIPIVRDPTLPGRSAAFSRWHWGKTPDRIAFSMRTERYRYTAYSTGHAGRHRPMDGTVVERELFDHDADPGETVNVAANEPTLVTELEARLFDHFNEDLREGLY